MKRYADFLPQAARPTWVWNAAQTAEIKYTDRETGTVVWVAGFVSRNEIPVPPRDLPYNDYAVQLTWREDWRKREGK